MTLASAAPRRAGDLWGLAGFCAAVAAVAALGSLTTDTGATYQALERPGWAPPSWLFGPVWTVLYLGIAVAGWLVWRRSGFGREMVPYGVQLVLNAAWTPVFFGADAYGAAVLVIVAMLAAIAATVAAFWRRHRAAAWLLLPYLAWVGYATALNTAIWLMN